MANGQFLVADAPGAVNRGLQFRQEALARPLAIESANLGIQKQEQGLTQGEQALKFGETKQRGLEQQIDERTDKQKNQSLFNTALRIGSAQDADIISILETNIAKVEGLGGTANESIRALELANAGDFQAVRDGAKSLIEIGVRQGDIKPPGGMLLKPTASQQDFETFKWLNEKAERTQDPTDIELAKSFGVQSGFDRLTPQELADIDVDKDAKKTLNKQAFVASKEAFDSLKGVRTAIANIDDAVRALEKGAETGPIISKLPSFRQATIELNTIKGRMGLDVIAGTTFGALSESELKFALNVALPDDLSPTALKDWLVRKRDAQTKLANELRKAASFLGTPGNTIAMYVDKLEAEAEGKKKDLKDLSDDELFN